ncbi:MAG: amidohydrolase family protein [Nitrososphaeraceae archaeon]
MNNLILTLISTMCILFSLQYTYASENNNITSQTVFDIAILNGRVIDPETMLDDIKNVGITDGKIVSVTNKTISGKEVIDATGLVVSPGFIDTHFHAIDPFGTKLGILDGVTTGGDLETGALDVDKFYRDKENRSKMNYMTTVGHGFARLKVLDNTTSQDIRTAFEAVGLIAAKNQSHWSTKISTPKELDTILAILDKGLREGAVGIGSPVGYMTEGVNAREMFEVQKLAGEYDRITSIHTRFLLSPPPTEFVLGGQEVIANALALNAPLIFAHMNNDAWDLSAELLKLARERGLNAWGEYYPYSTASTFIGADFLDPVNLHKAGRNASIIFDPSTGHRYTEQELIDARKNDPGRTIVFDARPSEWVLEWIKSPGLTVASDAMIGINKNQTLLNEDSPFEEFSGHPRTAGTHGKVLKLARDNGIPLMHVINQMSYLPAKYLGKTGLEAMDERGRIQEGKIADITIFDPKTVTDHSTYIDGDNGLPTTGIPYVIVNGEFVVKDSNFIHDSNPGQPIRFPVTINDNNT